MAATDTAPEFVTQLKQSLLDDLGGFEASREVKQEHLTERVAGIRRERYEKWADMAMSGTVPDDIAREKQQQPGNQLLSAQASLGRRERR